MSRFMRCHVSLAQPTVLCVDVYLGATTIILSARSRGPAAAIATEKATSCSARRRCGLAATAPGLRATDLSSLRKGYYGASPMPVEILRELQRRLPEVRCGTSTARRSGPGGYHPASLGEVQRAGSAGGAAPNLERWSSTTTANPPAWSGGEIVHRSPHGRAGATSGRGQDGRTFRGAGSTRRPGDDDRGRLPVGRRPEERHDQEGGETSPP